MEARVLFPVWPIRICLLVLSLLADVGLTEAQTNSSNYTLTRTYKVRGAVEASGSAYSGTPAEVSTQVAYFNGLGLPTQQVSANTGNTGQDMMTATGYDAYLRPVQSFAPVAAPGGMGAYVTTPIATYYNSPAVCNPTTAYYDQTLYEASPLNRPTEQRAVGVTTGVRTTYQTNVGTGTTAVIFYKVSGATLRDLTSAGYYPANTLTMTETKDENEVTTQSFHTSENRLVLKRIVTATENLDTYYVYDEAGQLRFVLQPNYQLEANLDKFAFMYLYNNRGLVVRKKVPGASEQVLGYDSRDRLSSLTDPRGNVWTYAYDELNRQTQVSVNANPISYTYYDSYSFGPFANGGNFTNELGLTAADHFVSAPQTESRLGLVTGELVRVLNADGTYGNWLQRVNYYDNRNRLIQSNRQLFGFLSTAFERVSYQYDFGGKPLTQRTSQYTGSVTYRLDKLFSYDQADRPTQVRHLIYENDVLIKSYIHSGQTYNQVGQLATTEWHNGTLGLTYKYTARGWVCETQSSKGPVFSHTMGYLANGNVQTITSGTNNQFTGSRTYAYDGANRLTGSSSSGSLAGFEENNLSYDRNGNLKTLNRSWNGTLIDQLTYLYTGNQLHRINDTGNNTLTEKGFANGADYDNELQYDAAGNLTGDANRSIGLSGILYNILNLPRQVTVGANQVLYVYDAKGSKRRTTSPGGVATTYEGGFEYNANGTLLRIGLEAGQLVRSSTGTYTVHYYYPDHLGNVRMVATETGGVVQQTEYYGFGLGVYRQGDMSVNKYGYLNREKQPETGWLDLLARMYDPTIGRFLEVDPMTQGQEHLSPYHYGYDNPLRFSDPDGLMAEGCCGGIGDFVTGVVTAMVDNGVGVNFRSQNGVGRSAGAYNAGQNVGDGLSMVQGALEIAVGAAGNTVAGVGELFSAGAATPVAVPLAVASSGLMAHGAVTAGRGAGSLLSQNGRLNAEGGRAGKQERLRQLSDDPKVGSSDRGWIKQDMKQIERGKRNNIRNPPGKDLAHERGREAAKGYSYEHSNLQDRKLHRLQHKHDNYGRKNKERPSD